MLTGIGVRYRNTLADCASFSLIRKTRKPKGTPSAAAHRCQRETKNWKCLFEYIWPLAQRLITAFYPKKRLLTEITGISARCKQEWWEHSAQVPRMEGAPSPAHQGGSFSFPGQGGIVTHPWGLWAAWARAGVPATAGRGTGRCEGPFHPKPFCDLCDDARLNCRGSLRSAGHFQLFLKAALRGAFTLCTRTALCALTGAGTTETARSRCLVRGVLRRVWVWCLKSATTQERIMESQNILSRKDPQEPSILVLHRTLQQSRPVPESGVQMLLKHCQPRGRALGPCSVPTL